MWQIRRYDRKHFWDKNYDSMELIKEVAVEPDTDSVMLIDGKTYRWCALSTKNKIVGVEEITLDLEPDQEPRGQAEYLEYRCTCEGGNRWVNKNPLLEEYVDCLHFILSIGNDLILYKYEYVELVDFTNDIIAQFNAVFRLIGNWKKEQLLMNNRFYFEVVNEFLCLGKMLGFTWEQIETAYLEKNKINHERQENGY